MPSEQRCRRRFPRYRTHLPIKIRTQQQHHLDGCSFVISEGGLGATLPELLPVGSMVQLLLSLPAHAMPLKVLAIVRNQVDCQYGFEFLSLTTEDRLQVRQFCDQLAAYQRGV